MGSNQPPHRSNIWRGVRKFFVSAFVVCTFAAYAIHERITAPDQTAGVGLPTQVAQAQQPTAGAPPPTATQGAPFATALPAAPPTAIPTAPSRAIPTAPPTAIPATPTAPAPTATPEPAQPALGLYKDGSYTGPEVDAFYGLVQVQATIQQGKITDVQFLEYPNDRRTSIRINNVAMPYLTTEAIQAQSAQVDVISGATLTSEAFARSLQSALEAAQAQA